MQKVVIDPAWSEEDKWRVMNGWIAELCAGGINGDNIQHESITGGAQGTGAKIAPDTVQGENVQEKAIALPHFADSLKDRVFFTLGGRKIFPQDAEPDAGTQGPFTALDIWIDTDGDNAMYEYNGTAWALMTPDSKAYYATRGFFSYLAAGIITADIINAVTIAGNKIYFGPIAGTHGELYVSGNVTYFDMYELVGATLYKRSSWTYNGLDFFNSDGTRSTRIATTTENKTITVGAGKDYAEISDAEASLPYIIAHDITIDVYTGDYAALITHPHIGNGKITIQEHTGETATIDYVDIRDCMCAITVKNFGLTSTTEYGAYFYKCLSASIIGCTCTAAAALKDGIVFSASKGVVNGCTVSNRLSGVRVNANSEVSILSTDGTGNGNYGIYCDSSVVHDSGGNTVTGAAGDRTSESGGLILGAWTAWNPDIGGLTKGNGVMNGSYEQTVKTFRGQMNFTWGNTTSASGALIIPLPVAQKNTYIDGQIIGYAFMRDNSTSAKLGADVVINSAASSNAVLYLRNSLTAVTAVSNTSPWAWATSDEWSVFIEYETA